MQEHDILVTQPRRSRERFLLQSALNRLGDSANIVHNPLEDRDLNGGMRAELLQAADVVIAGWGAGRLEQADYANAPNLKMVGLIGSSIKPVSPEVAWDRGIVITNTARAISQSVAEFTLGLMLNWLHPYPAYDSALKNGQAWEAAKQEHLQQDLCDLVVGLVGYGTAGRQVAMLVKAFGAKVLVYDPFVAPVHLVEQGLEHTENLLDLMRDSDIVSLHAGLTNISRHMIGRAQLEAMKRGALLINTGRGGLIDEAALVEMLEKRSICAALDVFETEPLPPDHPLRRMPNVTLSPHIAGFCNASVYRRCAMTLVDDVIRFLHGQQPANVVTPKMYSLMT